MSTTARTQPRSTPWWFAAGIGLLLTLGGAPARAQDPATPPKDESLDNLLKKLEEPKPDAEKDKDKPKGEDKEKDKDKPKDAKPADDKDKPKADAGKVAPKDESLDNLLQKLGASDDKPTAEDKPQPGGNGPMPPDDKPQPGGGGGDDKPKPEEMTGDQQKLDEHLRELTGKRNPKKNQQKQQGKGQGQGGGKGEGESGGPLDQVVDEMRDVQERLGQPDTGEDTRRKQAEIVKNLETLIEQMNQAQNQSQAMRQLRQGQKPGQNKPGDQNGAQATGPPPSKPATPKGQAPVALDKDAWGHLPQQLRDDFDNIFKEGPLPHKLDLIRQYYLSLNKKNATRGE